MDQQQVRKMSDDELFSQIGEVRTDHYYYNLMNAEVQRRQLIAQAASTAAQKAAADAARDNAKYMFWSVVIAAVATVVTALSIAANVFGR